MLNCPWPRGRDPCVSLISLWSCLLCSSKTCACPSACIRKIRCESFSEPQDNPLDTQLSLHSDETLRGIWKGKCAPWSRWAPKHSKHRNSDSVGPRGMRQVGCGHRHRHTWNGSSTSIRSPSSVDKSLSASSISTWSDWSSNVSHAARKYTRRRIHQFTRPGMLDLFMREIAHACFQLSHFDPKLFTKLTQDQKTQQCSPWIDVPPRASNTLRCIWPFLDFCLSPIEYSKRLHMSCRMLPIRIHLSYLNVTGATTSI